MAGAGTHRLGLGDEDRSRRLGKLRVSRHGRVGRLRVLRAARCPRSDPGTGCWIGSWHGAGDERRPGTIVYHPRCGQPRRMLDGKNGLACPRAEEATLHLGGRKLNAIRKQIAVQAGDLAPKSSNRKRHGAIPSGRGYW